MTFQIIREIRKLQIGAAPTFQIIRTPGGPRGQAAAQDLAFSFSGGLQASEQLPGLSVARPSVYIGITGFTPDPPAFDHVLQLYNRLGVNIGSVTYLAGIGEPVGVLAGGQYAAPADDFIFPTAPGSIDPAFQRGAFTLKSA